MGILFSWNDRFRLSYRKSNLINWRLIFYVLGVLLIVESVLFLLCAGVSLVYGEKEYIYFIYTMGMSGTLGLIMTSLGKGSKREMNRRDSYLVVSSSWLFFTIFGMLPFYLGGHIPTITDAFFETMSGFTTTGATILDNIESLPYGFLFWRSLTQWIGGLGIVFFTIALLPLFSGNYQQLFLSEATGVTHNKLHPRVSVMARWLWIVYIILTAAETILLMLGGMNLFDAVCHAFTTTATGGFSTKQASISYYNSPYIEYVISIFMILSGVNFSLYFLAATGRVKQLFRDQELHWFLKSVGFLTLMITVALCVVNNYDVETAFRKALFQVATCHTSCGFATDDFNLWPPFTWMLLLFAMLSGGCTGSTSGGIKNMRLLIIAKTIINQFKKILHPRAVLPVRVNKEVISSDISTTVYTFVITYILCVFVGWVSLMALGVGLVESMSTVISSIGNVGPALGAYGPEYSWATLPDAAKWILSILMFIGRLEIFGILLLFHPSFWKENC